VLRRVATVVVAASCSILAAGIGPADGAGRACARLKETSLHWDAVFSHVASVSEAIVLRRQIAHYGFQHVFFEKDWCDDIEVSIPGLDTPAARRAFFEEAYTVGFKVSFEPPYTFKKPRRGYVKAVFATRPTLSRANEFQRALAEKGYREGTDIERVSAHEWRIVLYRIPVRLRAKFKAEAKAAGFPVSRFER